MTNLEEQFKRHLQGRRFFNKQDTVVVAVSTGVDSMVLLTLLQKLPAACRPQLVVAHVNHELREQSIVEEEFIRIYCRAHHLTLFIKHWPRATHPASGVEEAGRRFRYQFFADLMAQTGARVVLTAHHENDLAETMLMKLARGGRLDQLVGIRDCRPIASGQLIRPLLPFPKAELVAYARAHHVKWYEDATNQDRTITRNRYRHEIIPALEKENPQLLDHLAGFHNQLQDLLVWRNQWLASQLMMISKDGLLDISKLNQYSWTQQRALLQQWLAHAGVVNVKAALLDELLDLLKDQATPQGQVALSGNQVLVREYNTWRIADQKKIPAKQRIQQPSVVKLGQQYFIDSNHFLVVTLGEKTTCQGRDGQLMWLKPDQFPLTLRQWRNDDFLVLKNGGHQKVRRVLIDQKVPQRERDHQLVLVDAHGQVVWLVQRKWSWFTRPQNFRQEWRPIIIEIKNK